MHYVVNVYTCRHHHRYGMHWKPCTVTVTTGYELCNNGGGVEGGTDPQPISCTECWSQAQVYFKSAGLPKVRLVVSQAAGAYAQGETPQRGYKRLLLGEASCLSFSFITASVWKIGMKYSRMITSDCSYVRQLCKWGNIRLANTSSSWSVFEDLMLKIKLSTRRLW